MRNWLFLKVAASPAMRWHRFANGTVRLAQAEQGDVDGDNAHNADHRSHRHRANALEERGCDQRADQHADDAEDTFPVAQPEPGMCLRRHLGHGRVIGNADQTVAGVVDQDDDDEIYCVDRVVGQAGWSPQEDRPQQDDRRGEHQEGSPAPPSRTGVIRPVADERVDHRIPKGGDEQQHTHGHRRQVDRAA